MFGLTKKFSCKKCGKTTIETIGITEEFTINNSEEAYIPVNCSHCEELHYVSANDNSQNNLFHVSEVKSLKKAGICFY